MNNVHENVRLPQQRNPKALQQRKLYITIDPSFLRQYKMSTEMRFYTDRCTWVVSNVWYPEGAGLILDPVAGRSDWDLFWLSPFPPWNSISLTYTLFRHKIIITVRSPEIGALLKRWWGCPFHRKLIACYFRVGLSTQIYDSGNRNIHNK
jgi:hypothetical protein